MNAAVELNLAFILFVPWFLILGALFWMYPRPARRSGARLGFDLGALLVAVVASVLATQWGYALGAAAPEVGAIWRQVLASLTSYAAFLVVLLIAWPLRARVVRG
ncbi:hypothetical protein [Coralloluteibacterium stylophorae]|uniref:Transmembrane protein n=1 Tax=Coralloluteibacterium stylophorae TaxID=1776034 RepID=A0A8J7VV13_9GAMM|nr:hypothetical protein [Coralloluteibacterium stylophorae]MBS7458199.1 hypothetical protein [Coralloluteibacterium stylophorae]